MEFNNLHIGSQTYMLLIVLLVLIKFYILFFCILKHKFIGKYKLAWGLIVLLTPLILGLTLYFEFGRKYKIE
jgi:hypothetical protein